MTIAFQSLAEETRATAAYEAGLHFEDASDHVAAEAQYRAAAQLGHTDAGVHLGCLIHQRDVGEAIRWLTWAWERGNPSGAFYLAVIYHRLRRVEEAERLYRQLVDSGIAPQCLWGSQGLSRIESERERASTPAPTHTPASSRGANAIAPTAPEDIRTYAIYDHPTDYPHGFVVREWLHAGGGIMSPGQAWTAPTLEQARELIPEGGKCLPRFAQDDPNIAEAWIVGSRGGVRG